MGIIDDFEGLLTTIVNQCLTGNYSELQSYFT
jgi:hypothetical protein